MEARSGQNCNNKIAPQVSFFLATVVLFISLCIFTGGTIFFFEVVAYYFWQRELF